MNIPTSPQSPGAISPRKLILAVILAGSILFFFLILSAGAVAILREAAPHGHGAGIVRIILAVRHAIAHHIFHHR